MAESTAERAFNLIDLEREILGEVPNEQSDGESRPIDFAPPRVRAPSLVMPDYVEHREGVTGVGKLSAEAVAWEYEAAAKEIEALAAQLMERVRQCETITRDAFAAFEEMRDTAGRYREEAKRIALEIERCALMTAEVRKTCAELSEKIAPETPVETTAKSSPAPSRRRRKSSQGPIGTAPSPADPNSAVPSSADPSNTDPIST
jgi:hypothetical protein